MIKEASPRIFCVYKSFILSAKAKKLLLLRLVLCCFVGEIELKRLRFRWQNRHRDTYLLLLREFFVSTTKSYQTRRTLELDEIHENHVRMGR